MKKKILIVCLLFWGIHSFGDNPKFYCYQGPGSAQNVFEGGYRSCPQVPGQKAKSGEKSEVCIQMALCVSPTPRVAKQILTEANLHLKKKPANTFEELTPDVVGYAVREILFKTGNNLAPVTTLICAAPDGICPDPDKCKEEVIYGLKGSILKQPKEPGLGIQLDDYNNFNIIPNPNDEIKQPEGNRTQ